MRTPVLILMLVVTGCASNTMESVTPEAPIIASSQPEILEASSNKLDVKNGEEVLKGYWTLSEASNPDIYEVPLDRDESREVCFGSGSNSFCRTVKIDDSYDFTVTYEGKNYPTRIIGIYRAPMGRFDAAYQAAHRGQTRIDIPEVYELVNVAIALTKKAEEQQGLVYTGTPYHADVQRYFAPVKDHPFVQALDREMRVNQSRYFHLKMNGYAFVYGAGDRIERSPIYDRTSFNGRPANDLLPFLPLMQDFSDKSGFRNFFQDHRPLYRSQIDYYRNDIDLAGMQQWLRVNFPAVKPYDSTNVIFSPLVAGSQSVTWIESNGFRELQPHVNFPYDSPDDKLLSKEAVALRKGYIVFTELNHGFINPTADNYNARINAALDHRAYWARSESPSDGYGTPYALFNEMMNWALVSLYLIDKAPQAHRDKMIARLNPYMAERRGFPQFPAFNAFLVDLYRKRPAGATVADLYPKIIDWFEAQDDRPKQESASATPAKN